MTRTSDETAGSGPPCVGENPAKFRLAVLAFQRARQLVGGARPRVLAGSHKPLQIALREVLAGTISWSVDELVEPKAPGVAAER